MKNVSLVNHICHDHRGNCSSVLQWSPFERLIWQAGHSHFSTILDYRAKSKQSKAANCKEKRAGQKLVPNIEEEWARSPVWCLVPNLYFENDHSFFNVSSDKTFQDRKTIDFADIPLLLQVSEECVVRVHSNYWMLSLQACIQLCGPQPKLRIP